MNSKICAGTEMSEDAYYGLKGNNPEVYDPSGSLLFPRDGDYADGDGNYVNAIAIVQTEGYDATRAEAFNAMPDDQDFQEKANEACLIEFEFHDYATSESRTDFCCQGFDVDG